MACLNKVLKNTVIAAGALTGLYYGVGGVLCVGALGRPALNRKPEEALNDPGMLKRYQTNEIFRKADDWYMANTPNEVTLVNTAKQTLHAELIRAKTDEHKWVVLNHGYSSRPRTMALQGVHFYENGYHVLFPYLRGHRKSEQFFTTMGYYERYDVAAWIRYIVSIDPEAQIVVMGCSMGAATTMLTLGETLPQNVKCAVEDCGFTNCREQFTEQIANILHVPPFPFLNAANSFSKLFLNWDFKECSPLKAIERSVTPTLFIHGEEDHFVPYDMFPQLYEACNAEKDYLSVPGAGHDLSCYKQPEMYWEKVDAFVSKYVK